MDFLEKLRSVEEKYLDLERKLADPGDGGDWQVYRELGKERSDLEPVVFKYREYLEAAADKEENREHYYQRERIVGNFARSFSLHAEVNPDKIKAEFKDGILTLQIPKPEEHKPKKITVH